MTGRASKIRSGRRGWPRLSCGYEQWLFLTRSPPFCVVQRVHVDLLDPWTLNAVWISANPVLQCVGCQVGYGVFRIHCIWILNGAKRCVFLALRPWVRLCLYDVLHIPEPTENCGDGYDVGMLFGEAAGSSKDFLLISFFYVELNVYLCIADSFPEKEWVVKFVNIPWGRSDTTEWRNLINLLGRWCVTAWFLIYYVTWQDS